MDNIDFDNVSRLLSERMENSYKNQSSFMPPNAGRTGVPHILSFQGLTTTLSHIYRITDEALLNSFDNAKFMRNNLVIMECLEARRRSTALLDWHLQAEDENDKEQMEAINVITRILRGIPKFTQFRECLMDAIWYGKYGVQLQYGKGLIGNKVCTTINRWIPLNGDKIVYRLEEGRPFEREQIGIRIGRHSDLLSESQQQQIEPTDLGWGYFLLPDERDLFVIHNHMVEDGDYDDPLSAGRIHGVGIRSRIYWTYYMMQEALAWLMEFLERSASGFEIWYYPSGNDKIRKETEEAAKNRIGHSSNIILVPRPLGEAGAMFDVKRIEPAMGGANVLHDILREYYGHQIKRYILGQTLTTEAQATGLGSGLANIHLDTFLQIVKYDAINLSESITRDLIQPLLKYNYPYLPKDSVRFVIETESQDPETKLRAAFTAYQMGAGLSESEIVALAGCNLPGEGDTILKRPDLTNSALNNGINNNAQGINHGQFPSAKFINPAPNHHKRPDEILGNVGKIFNPSEGTSGSQYFGLENTAPV